MSFSYIKNAVSHCKSKISADDKSLNVAFATVLASLVLLAPELSIAQDVAGGTEVENTVCRIVSQLQGPIARGIAAFGIIFLGFSLFLGKITWGTALALGIGIGAIFGAEQIVGVFAGDGGETCSGF